MTTNQLKWAEIKENVRHNVASEQISGASLQESIRHNVETEGINWYANETSRVVGLGQVSAAQRQASAALANAAENVRHNTASEAIETARVEAYTTGQNSSAELNYSKAAGQDFTNMYLLPQQQGLNSLQQKQYIADTARSYAEANRANMQAEYAKWQKYGKQLEVTQGIFNFATDFIKAVAAAEAGFGN